MLSSSSSCIIHPTPVTFSNRDLLSAAALWTKQRIFSGGTSSEDKQKPTSWRKSDTDFDGRRRRYGGEGFEQQGPRITIGCQGQIVAIFDNCVEVWKHLENDDLELIGRTKKICHCYIVDCVVIDNDKVIIQIQKGQEYELEIHRLQTATCEPMFRTLILPPCSSGLGPFKMLYSGRFLVVVTTTGSVTVFCVDQTSDETADSGFPSFTVHPLCPFETQLNCDASPLIDIQGDWLVYCPTVSPCASDYTSLNLPPSSPLYERLVENLSSTAAVSLKTLSDAGVAGIKHYLSKDNIDIGSNSHFSSGYFPHINRNNNLHNSGNYSDNNYEKTNDNDNIDNTNTNTNNNSKSGRSLSLGLLSGLLFPGQTDHLTVQLVDLKSSKKLACFAPLYGASYLSLSPHDATLAVVSTKGDAIYSYDLSFVPKEVTVTGRYLRGKLPSIVTKVIWDACGAFGVLTAYKGTLHWFDKQFSFRNSNKIWKLSGWGIQQGEWLMNPLTKESQILVVRSTDILLLDAMNGGECKYRYELAHNPVELEDGSYPCITNNSEIEPRINNSSERDGEPLSYFELETCMPYPFIHTDRRVIISKFDDYESIFSSKNTTHSSARGEPQDGVYLPVFGIAMPSTVVDFGNADGQVKFSPTQDSIEGEDLEEEEIIRRAMESVVLPNTGDKESLPKIKDEDDIIFE